MTSKDTSNLLDPGTQGFLARRPIIGLALFLLGGLIFIVLAISVRANGSLLGWDSPIDQALHIRATHDTPIVVEIMRFCGALGQNIAVLFVTLIGLYWFFKRYWYELGMLLIGVSGGTLWFVVISNMIGRHRPVFPDPLESIPGPGFPSGHSITSMLFYGLILYLLLPHLSSWRWRFVAVLDAALIILLVGFSRLYFGSHYPTDVLGGYTFGLTWGALVYTCIELYRKHRSVRHTKTIRANP